MSPLSKPSSKLRLRSLSDERKESINVSSSSPVSSSPLAPPSRPWRRRSLLLLLSTISTAFYLSLRRTNPPVKLDSYVLCTRDSFGIYTVDELVPQAQCLVVHDSHFIDVGSLDNVTERWITNASTLGVSLPVRYAPAGAIIVPGMSDAHGHILEYGAMKQMPLEGTKTREATVERVKQYILSDLELKNDRTKFVEGWGWDHTQWVQEGWPAAADFELDPEVRNRPIVLQSKDGHALWVSQKVIDAMEVIPDEVEGGVIVRDSSGKPTGVFLDNAQELVKRPDPTPKMLKKRFTATVKDALAMGLTSVHDAGFNPVSLEFFHQQAEQGQLPIRVYGMTYFDETAGYWGNETLKIVGAGNNRLSARSVKIFADGALRSGGAALYEPYTDNPETSGFMRIAPEVLNTIIPNFLRDGWQVNVHAIGDRANGLVLDAFEAALKDVDVVALRPRLEHAQILTKADMARFGDLGVIASIQPTHAISDMWYAEDRLGPDRVKGLYAFRNIIDHGARIALGSDFPVEDINPMAGFYAAITRLSPDGKSPHGPGGWFPEQIMTRAEALKGMTLDPAWASFTETSLGSISTGKSADYVILSQDIMAVPTDKILSTKVLTTAIDGEIVYGDINM